MAAHVGGIGLQNLANNWRMTPATTATYISEGAWIPARHLMYISMEIARRVSAGGARLLISVPPRHGKSELGSVWTPIWFLDHWPKKHVILSSYGADLATDFSRKVRDTINEDDRFKVQLKKDTLRADRFKTDEGGGLFAVGVGGPATGRGADLLILDDYFKNFEESESPVKRESVWNWFRSVARTRVEPGGSIIVIATRWHIDDITAKLLAKGGWTYIELPAFAYEGDLLSRAKGEVLWPERYDSAEMEAIKDELGTYIFNAMYQQRPLPSVAAGDLIENIRIVDIAPTERLQTVRSWDLAGTLTGDWSVGTLLGYDKVMNTTYILDQVAFRAGPADTEDIMRQTADFDGHDTAIVVEEEPGSSGKISIHHIQTNVLKGYRVHPVKPTGPKHIRASPMIAGLETGRKVVLLRGEWNAPFIDELRVFPDGDYDDRVDSAAHGYNRLHGKKYGSPVWGRVVSTNTAEQSQVASNTRRGSGRIITGVTWGR